MRTLYRLTDSETPLGNVVLFVMMLGVLMLFGFVTGCDVPEGVQAQDTGYVREMAPPARDSMPDAAPVADARTAEVDTRVMPDVQALADTSPARPDTGRRCSSDDACGSSACITPRDNTTPYVVSHACVDGQCTERRFLCAGVACVGRGGYSRVSGCLQPYGAACQPIDMPAVLCPMGYECRDGGRVCTPQ